MADDTAYEAVMQLAIVAMTLIGPRYSDAVLATMDEMGEESKRLVREALRAAELEM